MITEQEKEARFEEVKYAKASVELEGIHLSDELLEISNEYIQGSLTSEEYSAKLLYAIDHSYA